MALICLVIYLVFAVIWYLPLYKKQPQDETRLNTKELKKALFTGLIPAFLVSLIFQSLVALIMKAFGLQGESLAFKLIMNVIGYAIGEETVKYLFANRLLKKNGYRSPCNTALLFGAVGAGFGLVESFMVILASPNIVNAVMRGVVSLHVFLQLWMGLGLGSAEALKSADPAAAKKMLVRAFSIPVAVHILQDVSGTLGGTFMTDGSGREIPGAVILLVSLAVDIVFIVKTIKAVKRSAA